MTKINDEVAKNYKQIKRTFPHVTLVFQVEMIVNDVRFSGPDMYEEEFLKFLMDWEGPEIVGFVWATDHGWTYEWKPMGELY
jgi:hypothetical protein